MRRLLLLGTIAAGLAAAGSLTASAAQRPAPFRLSAISGGPTAFRDAVVSGRRLQSLRSAGEWGGSITASDGEVVQIRVSDAYPVDPTYTQGIADFMVQLYHGSELGKAIVHILPLDQLHAVCGDRADGCYDPDTQEIVITGDTLADGVAKETILVHELGHNVARNRINPPWVAVDWGTKRWATAERVCPRTAAGTAFPGDEGDHYYLNPGEAFAESYRVLNFYKEQWPNWTVLAPWNSDQSFFPNQTELGALQQDVVTPWTGPTVTSWTSRVVKVTRAVRRSIQTPLDGTVRVRVLRAPKGVVVSILNPSSGKAVATGNRLTSATVCGERSLTVSLRARAAGPFSATIATP